MLNMTDSLSSLPKPVTSPSWAHRTTFPNLPGSWFWSCDEALANRN